MTEHKEEAAQPNVFARAWHLLDGVFDAISTFVSTVAKGVEAVRGIIAILALLGVGISGIGVVASVANQSQSSATATPLATTTPIVTMPSSGVPNVYGRDATTAGQMLKDAGYPARRISVCSGSVAAGNVRQVLTDVGAADGVVLVDQAGVTPAGRTLATGTAVVAKISTGVPCG